MPASPDPLPAPPPASSPVGSSLPLSRRRFLASSAAVLGFPTIIPASALGRDGVPAPSERITLGAIGLGAQGTGDLQMFLNLDTVRVTALCDVNRRHLDRARKIVADRYGAANGVRALHDFRELNALDDLDAVLIALPVHWHTIPALDAIARGKHVFLEKPMALSFAEAAMVRAAVRRHGVKFQFGTQQRSDLKFRWACELARNGRIGRLEKIEVGVPGGITAEAFPEEPVPEWVDWDRWVGPAPMGPFHEKRLAREFHENMTDYSLGMISCWGIHHLDIAQWGNGTDATGPTSIEAEGAFPKSGSCDAILTWRVRYEFADAAPVEFADNAGIPQGVKFIGDAGWVHVRRDSISANDDGLLRDPANKAGTMPIALPVSADHQHDLIDAIREDRPTVAGIESAVRSDTLCQLGLIAVHASRKITWDPASEAIVGDPESAARLAPRPARGPWQLPA